MAYQKGTANDPKDLLQKLAAFLSTNGWTQDMNQAVLSGWRLHMHKDSTYIHIRGLVNESADHPLGTFGTAISGYYLYLGTGFDAGQDWKSQPGSAQGSPGYGMRACGLPSVGGAILAYHFFTTDANNNNVVVVIERAPRIFGHFGWGLSLEKLGAWIGGAYYFGSLGSRYTDFHNQAAGPGFSNDSSYPPGTLRNDDATVFVRCDADTFTGKWVGITGSLTDYQGYTGRRGESTSWCGAGGPGGGNVPSIGRLQERLTNQLNGQSLLLPIRFAVERGTGGYSFIGSLPNIYVTNACAKGFTPATQYSWGTDDYIVFPGPNENPSMGFAVRKV